MKRLILTGWGWKDYACAAALALRHFKAGDVLVFEKHGSNLTRAAEALKVSRNTARKYLEK